MKHTEMHSYDPSFRKYRLTEYYDPYYTLRQWKQLIEELIEEFGQNAFLGVDAGANNVLLEIDVLKK